MAALCPGKKIYGFPPIISTLSSGPSVFSLWLTLVLHWRTREKASDGMGTHSFSLHAAFSLNNWSVALVPSVGRWNFITQLRGHSVTLISEDWKNTKVQGFLLNFHIRNTLQALFPQLGGTAGYQQAICTSGRQFILQASLFQLS